MKTGRKEGFVPSESSRMKARLSNPTRISVSTPNGDFMSIRAASKALNISVGLVQYYCDMGAKQRKGAHLLSKINKKPLKDYTAWVKNEKHAKSANMIDTTSGPVSSPSPGSAKY